MDPMPSRAARTAYVVLTVIFWCAVLLGAIAVLHRLFGLGQDAGTLTLPASVNVPEIQLPQGFETGPMDVSVDVRDPSLKVRVVATAPVLFSCVLALVGLWLLRKVARSAARGDPFEAANVTRLRWLGALFLVGVPLMAMVGSSFEQLLFSSDVWTGPVPPHGFATGTDLLFSAPAIMAAVCLFALAEVFGYGSRLREDVDATI
jgi:hypothetical protein